MNADCLQHGKSIWKEHFFREESIRMKIESRSLPYIEAELPYWKSVCVPDPTRAILSNEINNSTGSLGIRWPHRGLPS